MCRHMYDWNVVNCDVKQPIHLTNSPQVISMRMQNCDKAKIIIISSFRLLRENNEKKYLFVRY